MENKTPNLEIPDTRWSGLYKTGGVAAFVIAGLLICEFYVFSILPQPTTIIDIFTMFQNNWLIGLLKFDLLGMIAYIFFIPLILAICFSVRRASESISITGTVLFFVGIAAFFASNTAFPLLSLSSEYATAMSEAQKAMYLAAGQAMLTMFNVNAFQVSYVIVSAGWLLVSVATLRSNIFGKFCAWSGILAGAAGIAGVTFEHMPVLSDFLFIAIIFYFAAIVFLMIWVFLSGKRLLRLGKEGVA